MKMGKEGKKEMSLTQNKTTKKKSEEMKLAPCHNLTKSPHFFHLFIKKGFDFLGVM